MKTIILITIISLISLQRAFSQSTLDTIYTNTGTIAVTIKEVTPDAVKFSYPNEDLLNSIYKNTVFKIKYKSGRIEVFSEQSSFKDVKGGDDWEKVSITRIESELKGLFKLEEVTSKATGATVFSNVNQVKDRAFKKLQIEAAMLGANIIYIIEQQTNGVEHYYGGSNPARTNLSGVAYSNKRPDFTVFDSIVRSKNKFKYLEKQSFGNNSTEIYKDYDLSQDSVKILSIKNENGFAIVKTNIMDEDAETDYRVTYFDDQKIILMYRSKKRIYNFILSR